MCSQNDQCDAGIILSHRCWGRDPPPPGTAGRAAPAQTPLPARRPRRGRGGLGKRASVPSPPPPPAKQFSSRPACKAWLVPALGRTPRGRGVPEQRHYCPTLTSQKYVAGPVCGHPVWTTSTLCVDPVVSSGTPRGALEGKGPQRRPQMVGLAEGGGCQSGWGRCLSLADAIETGTSQARGFRSIRPSVQNSVTITDPDNEPPPTYKVCGGATSPLHAPICSSITKCCLSGSPLERYTKANKRR